MIMPAGGVGGWMGPDFSAVSVLQEKHLRDKLLMARRVITHPAEKGRSLEAEVAAVVRELLPAQYGVGTGFIAHHGNNGPELSSQLDILIYDTIRGGPISRLAGCEIYPIEAVYAYIEVKAVLDFAAWTDEKPRDNSLQRCLQQNSALRKLRTRMFIEPTPPVGISLVTVDEWLPVRAFVFAFETTGNQEPKVLAQRMANLAKRSSAHIHGVLLLDRIYLRSRAVDVKVAAPTDYYHVEFTTESTLTALRLHLLSALGSFTRPKEKWIPAWDTYFAAITDWAEVAPTE